MVSFGSIVFVAALGALSGMLEGVVLAILVAASQRRRGMKSSPAFQGQMVMGGVAGAAAAGIAGVWLGRWAAVGIGAMGWPVVWLGILGGLAIAEWTEGRRR